MMVLLKYLKTKENFGMYKNVDNINKKEDSRKCYLLLIK